MIAFIKKELEIPKRLILDVANILCKYEVTNEIVGVDEDEGTLTLELQYTKKERRLVLIIEDMIDDDDNLDRDEVEAVEWPDDEDEEDDEDDEEEDD